MIARIIKAEVCVVCRSRRLRRIPQETTSISVSYAEIRKMFDSTLPSAFNPFTLRVSYEDM